MKKRIRETLFVCVGVLISILFVLTIPQSRAYAAPSKLTIQTVDYDDENIIINNNENERIYFATDQDAAKDKWEVLDCDSDDTTSIDFSWLSPTIENVLVFKGDKNSTQVSVTIKEKTQKLSISISYAKAATLNGTDTIGELLNIMTTAGTANEPIEYSDLEWKKGTGGRWQDINKLTVATMQKLQIKGADLYFRIKAVNDTTVGSTHPDGKKGNRASNEVKLKIAKKQMAAVVSIDGSKFTAGISYGKEYRLTIAGQPTTNWLAISDRAIKKLSLKDMFKNFSYDADGIGKPFPEVYIEIRSCSTSKTDVSKITEIELKEQKELEGSILAQDIPENPTAADLKNIYVGYNGNRYVLLTVPQASISNPYEYCVSKTAELDVSKAVWATITKNTAVKILSNKAVDGGYLYVRQKEVKYKAATKTTEAVEYQMASTCKVYQISYPEMPSVTKQSFNFIKKYSEDIVFNITTHTGTKKPYETKILSIKIGSQPVSFDQEIISDTTQNPVVHMIKVTLHKEELNSMSDCQNRALMITFENGTVDKANLKISIKNATRAGLLGLAIPTEGTTAGTIKMKTTSTVGSGNELVYKLSDSEVKDIMTSDTITDGTPFVSEGDIAVTAGKYITVYEVNKTTKAVVKAASVLVKDEYIKK